MIIREHIPYPLLYNPLKHHLGFCRVWITQKQFSKESILTEIAAIGHSTLDFYTGDLTVTQISNEITEQLKQMGVYTYKAYLPWLKSNGVRYNYLHLSDGSSWTFLLGNQGNRYIHFHPSRKSTDVCRLRGITLQTALLVHLLAEKPDRLQDLEWINHVRLKYLNLSPLRDWKGCSGLSGSIQLLSDPVPD